MSQTSEPLDHYGRMAKTWWETHHPTELRQMTAPAAFFGQVSSAVRDEISRAQTELQCSLPDNLDYLDRVAAIHQTQTQATEVVLAEWFPESGGPARLPHQRV